MSASALPALRQELIRQGLDGFIVPRADEHLGEYVPASAERLAWLTGFTGSAGLAIQGAVIYDAVAADHFDADTHTADAVAYPLEKRISFTTGLFAWPALADTITDTHLVVRDRFGRMVVFLARILHDRVLPGAKTAYALGIDQASAVVVDPDGTATVLNGTGGRGAYLVRAHAVPDLQPGQPVRYTVEASHIGHNGARFDLLRKTTRQPWYSLTVDGSRSPVYSRDPYQP